MSVFGDDPTFGNASPASSSARFGRRRRRPRRYRSCEQATRRGEWLADLRQQGARGREVRAVLLGRVGIQAPDGLAARPEGDDVLRSARAGDPHPQPRRLRAAGDLRRARPTPSNPDVFDPTPWESYTYDANDNAGRTHAADSTGYQHHWNTPSSVVDRRSGPHGRDRANATVPNPATDWYITRSTYDIRGNLLTITDPLGRRRLSAYVYDLANRSLRTEQLDAGLRRMVLDAAGNTVEQRDSKGALVLHAYDALNRPMRLWARDGTGQPSPCARAGLRRRRRLRADHGTGHRLKHLWASSTSTTTKRACSPSRRTTSRATSWRRRGG